MNVADVLSGTARWAMLRGNSLELLRSLPDASVDAIITDPPYSSGGFTRGDRTADTSHKYVMSGQELEWPEFQGDTRDQHAFRYWEALWLAECLRIAKPGAPVAVFTDWRQLAATTDAIQAGGWVLRGIVVWDKTEAARPTEGRFASQCEFVVWGSNGPMSLERDMGDGVRRTLPGVIRANVDRQDKHHMTGKPTIVMQSLVRICSQGGVVVDPFGGSGTTGVGALLEGRRFIGIEITDEYSKIARERLEAAASSVSLKDYRAGQMPIFGVGT